ncbi:MAG TPA: urate hydroxylase PuuD [Patescibacteria group bacterium]|nr:urate hydroxylase PuuD [Patescibacteria group bacterium]
MDIDLAQWLNLALRWFHLMLGIMWIGASFYFVWLDLALRPAKEQKDREAGVSGEVWAVHGGGFYHKKKYLVAPEGMPDDLHWFKWEAYLTFISGFLLLCLMYYWQADLYLIDPERMNFTPAQATFTGLAFLLGGWFFYDELCKSAIGQNDKAFSVIWAGALIFAAYALSQLFTGRGAFIHVGAMIGTAMTANVFAVIIPNQKRVVAALLRGDKPDAKYGKIAKQRSMHNNYMTLPVLLIMISNHFPVLYAGDWNWAILAGLALSSWPFRHFFNLKDRGITAPRFLIAGMAGFILTICAASGLFAPAKPVAAMQAVSPSEVRKIVRTHCSGCHSDTPVHDSVSEAPKGVAFDTMAEIKQFAPRIIEQAVKSDTMPLGNETGMTKEERARLGDGLAALSGKRD